MKDVFGNEIFFAPGDKIATYSPEVDHVLTAIAPYMSDHPDTWLKRVWVSDMSSIGDFNLENHEVEEISQSLGIPIGDDDYLWEVSKSLRERAFC